MVTGILKWICKQWTSAIGLDIHNLCMSTGLSQPHSVEGRMLKVAFDKLKLEHLVIEKGQFRQEKNTNTLEESDLLALLQQGRDEEEELMQTEISEPNLLRLLDRSDMLTDPAENKKAMSEPLPLKRPGWEVVVRSGKGRSVLSSIEGYRQLTSANQQNAG